MTDDIKINENNAEILATPTSTYSPIVDGYGVRPECFKSTLQEVLFILTATMAIGISSMTAGSVTVISSFVARDLNMTTPQITWMSASTSYVDSITYNTKMYRPNAIADWLVDLSFCYSPELQTSSAEGHFSSAVCSCTQLSHLVPAFPKLL
jgi:hypothetical protein